jgi:photosystem II stability/assembly factor-like uncharacterized protein
MMKYIPKWALLLFLSLAVCLPNQSFAQKRGKKKDKEEKAETPKDTIITGALVGGLKWRSIGPAWASGRIADFAVNPKNPSEYIVGVASGNVFKTVNNGTTWMPIFEGYGSYAIGDVEYDPSNHNVIWVGTGENNHQRATGYGDGIYKSVDGGKSFKNMGLKDSRQIGGIVVHPENGDVVFVACEGSIWGPGGERGLYKTTDGGKTWNKVLEISENTGVNNVIMDPSDSNIMYATSEQRRRHHYGKIGGGPESAVYKSTDGGETWTKKMKGLPRVHIGGMGIDVSPVDPNVVYLIVEAAEDQGGFYRSDNKGETWNKMGSYHSSGQYYNEIYCDPVNVNKVFSTETRSKYTVDGGKTWKNIGNNNRHVDDHALWIDPSNTNHFMIGGDGGIYETYDHGANWDFKENLPITQFYRVAVDDAEPFYNVYGGTQDNNSMGGPSRTLYRQGATNDDWVRTLGGDGFWQAIEPGNPNIVYSEYQYGNMFRYDKQSGAAENIKPRERKDELAYKWNWDTPLFISPHSPTRLYVAANKVFRSDDRGNSWEVISDDLTAQMDRDSLKFMDKYWSPDAVVKHVSTSQWGTIVSLDESRVQEGLLYAGTDDGVISVTEDNGATWHQVKSFPGVPQYTYVSDIQASKHDANVVFATFQNIKMDDFKPYVFKSTDKGRTWKSISGNLPKNHSVHSIQQDHKVPNLIFAGTELGVFFSINGGEHWVQLKSGIPTISVRDIAIQEREGDLVLATFGRGFYIMDDYSPLRIISHKWAENEAYIFPIKDALMYNQMSKFGNQGSTYYKAKNPEYGATFTYYIKDVPKTKKQLRKEEEKKLFKDGKYIPQPTWRELQLEGDAEKSHLIFSIYDKDDNVIRRMTKAPSKGIKRITWDLSYNSPFPQTTKKFNPLKSGPGFGGRDAVPGTYKVGIQMWHEGELSTLVEPVEFKVKELNNSTLPNGDVNKAVAFDDDLIKMFSAMQGAQRLNTEMIEKVETIKQTLYNTPAASQELKDQARALGKELEEIKLNMSHPEFWLRPKFGIFYNRLFMKRLSDFRG